MFSSIDEAARGLLLTTCNILNDEGIRYVIAGGWVPFLRGGAVGLKHPGTRDVDVLFHDELSNVSLAINALMRHGFVPSGKHEFQLLLPIKVGQRNFIFNVDLMHPREQQEKPGMFADIFELGVDDAYDPTGKRWLKSIIFSGAAVVFNKVLWSNVSIQGTDAGGSVTEVKVPLLDEVALILSKASSVKNEKRTRDAFDIYYVLYGAHKDRIVAILHKLAAEYSAVKEQLDQLIEWTSQMRETFNANVNQYAHGSVTNAAEKVIELLRS
jgi:hypothetical protein